MNRDKVTRRAVRRTLATRRFIETARRSLGVDGGPPRDADGTRPYPLGVTLPPVPR